MLDAFARAGHDEIDTAIAYANGETERILGRVDAGRRARVDTKANPWPGGTMTPSAGRGGLGANELRAQVRRSVESLRGTKIRTLYLHAPDADTTLEEALRECERLRVEERAFEDVGLSNFSAWETVKAHELCEKYGWKRPTIYQGMYNALTRNVEAELVPALRATKMRFAAYNPLCGGLLTGKYKGNTDVGAVSGGRFAGNDMYQSRFWLPCYHEAVAERGGGVREARRRARGRLAAMALPALRVGRRRGRRRHRRRVERIAARGEFSERRARRAAAAGHSRRLRRGLGKVSRRERAVLSRPL